MKKLYKWIFHVLCIFQFLETFRYRCFNAFKTCCLKSVKLMLNYFYRIIILFWQRKFFHHDHFLFWQFVLFMIDMWKLTIKWNQVIFYIFKFELQKIIIHLLWCVEKSAHRDQQGHIKDVVGILLSSFSCDHQVSGS